MHHGHGLAWKVPRAQVGDGLAWLSDGGLRNRSTCELGSCTCAHGERYSSMRTTGLALGLGVRSSFSQCFPTSWRCPPSLPRVAVPGARGDLTRSVPVSTEPYASLRQGGRPCALLALHTYGKATRVWWRSLCWLSPRWRPVKSEVSPVEWLPRACRGGAGARPDSVRRGGARSGTLGRTDDVPASTYYCLGEQLATSNILLLIPALDWFSRLFSVNVLLSE